MRERRCLKMPPPYNLEASWKEGNFRFSLLGQLHSSAKDRRGAFQAREAQGRAEACSGWGRGLRHRGQIGRAVVGRKVGQRRWRTGLAWGRVGGPPWASPWRQPVGRQPGWTAADRGDWPPWPPHRSSLGRWERTRQSSLSRPGRGRETREGLHALRTIWNQHCVDQPAASSPVNRNPGSSDA